jgi:hypothetical protein
MSDATDLVCAAAVDADRQVAVGRDLGGALERDERQADRPGDQEREREADEHGCGAEQAHDELRARPSRPERRRPPGRLRHGPRGLGADRGLECLRARRRRAERDHGRPDVLTACNRLVHASVDRHELGVPHPDLRCRT